MTDHVTTRSRRAPAAVVTTTEDGIDARFTGRSVTFRPGSSSAQVSSVEVGEGAPGDLVGVVRR